MEAVAFKHLSPGAEFAVIVAFTDYDGGVHPVGERWTYRGKSFLPYDDGLSLFVSIGGIDRQIRMQWRDEEQGTIIDALDRYLKLA